VASAAAAQGNGAASAKAASPGATALPAYASLGAPSDQAALVTALQRALGAPTGQFAAVQPVASAFQPCLAVAAAEAQVASSAQPVLEATVTFAGTRAQATVFASAGHHVAAVVAVPGCRPLTKVTF
jgi:hypothetical protein